MSTYQHFNSIELIEEIRRLLKDGKKIPFALVQEVLDKYELDDLAKLLGNKALEQFLGSAEYGKKHTKSEVNDYFGAKKGLSIGNTLKF